MSASGTSRRQVLIDLASVTAISVVIWLYAAGQTLQTRPVSFDVEFESGDPSRVEVASPGVLHVNLEISGSQQSVTRATESLSGRTIRLVTGADGIPASPGEHVIVLEDALAVSPSFAPLGVDLSGVAPATVRLVLVPR